MLQRAFLYFAVCFCDTEIFETITNKVEACNQEVRLEACKKNKADSIGEFRSKISKLSMTLLLPLWTISERQDKLQH